jgi:hypothetical protein
MKTQQPTDRSPTPDSDAAPAKYRLLRWQRTAILVVTVAALMYVGYGFGQLFAEWRQDAQPVASASAATFALNPLAGALPFDGPWSFADLDWNLRSAVLNRAELDARLAALSDPPAGDIKNYPDVSSRLLDLIDTLRLQPVEHSGCQLFRIDRPDFYGQLLVRIVEGRTKAVAFACAYPQVGRRWQIFELTPRAASPTTTAKEAHLLPLPAGAVRRGGRFADDGRLLLELISLEGNADSLIAEWKDAGWEVRPSGFGDGNGFSYLCARGNDVVYAWSANSNESLRNLMLVRTPTDAELQAQQLIPKE